MKVDRLRLKKSTSEVPPECQVLIDRLKHCDQSQLLHQLANIETWSFGKCELYHWIDVLDIFDDILEKACRTVGGNRWALACDNSYTHDDKKLVLWTLHFTTLLIEHSFSRHLYNSMEHLNALLTSSDMQIVMGVLNLLYMFSKRSNFITRLSSDKRQILLPRLHYLAESWGGKDNGFGLADCCNNEKPIPSTATTLHFEFYCDTDTNAKNGKHPINCIHLENIDKMIQSPAEIMRGLVQLYNIPPDKTFLLFTHVRLAYQFSDYKSRLLRVQARLQALSVLVYSNALQDKAHTLLYPGLLEELVELLELQLPYLVDIRSAALRTLTSIIHLDRNPHFPKRSGSRLIMIIDVTGASLYHGFLPVLVRTCIATLTQPRQEGSSNELFPLPLATALFSFLYHLASYEAGGDALVNCGMMESLLHVINWHGNELEHITFVTRAVRVIDLITNIDMQSFQAHGGLQSFINRLNVEVNICREEQGYDLDALIDKDLKAMEDRAAASSSHSSSDDIYFEDTTEYSGSSGKTCLPQRAALLKSMLNFLKKALQDPTFSDSIRHVMEGTLPSSLKHIIGNAEYYGPSLFLLATDVVTVYVFQEPSLLSSLQDNGLTDVVLHSLLIKDVPATREVLGSLPNVFSALCLNTRGLVSFVTCQPFDRLFKVLLSPMYLPAMRRRRTSDPLGDTATNLGNAMDELMRHQPSLKVDATAAIIKLLQELCHLGTDSKYVCHRATQNNSKSELSLTPVSKLTEANEGSSDEDDEDEEEASTSSHTQRDENGQESNNAQISEKTPIVLVDYILNVMKFVDAILSNNSTDDHCREFVNQGGLVPLLKILGLPNLPVDCPVTQAAQAVASVCKSILNLAQEPKVLNQGLTQLGDVLHTLEPLCTNLEKPGGSILLHELANAPNIETAFSNPSATPLLHAMNAAHGYVLMFVHVCRTGQNEVRTLSLTHWGSDEGLNVLSVLAELYTSLVWESTLLLALCSDDIIPANCDFGKEDMDKLLLSEKIAESDGNVNSANVCNDSSNGMTSAMEALRASTPMGMDVDIESPLTSTTTNVTTTTTAISTTTAITTITTASATTSTATVTTNTSTATVTTNTAANNTSGNYSNNKSRDERSPPTNHQLKYIKPLLGASSRLGRALAELFGLLVKLCVGSPNRQRRGQNIVSQPHFPGPFARSVATALNYLLASGLNWEKLPVSPIPKFRLTFLICSVGFTSPMLFDEKRYPYHLMLHRFVSLSGQATFFNTFRWALSAGGRIPLEQGLEHADLPDGTGEFLDAWLMLLEKMVNPKAILDSPHVISKQGAVRSAYRNCTFDPVKYLVQIHKLAFEAVMLMWGKKPLTNYGGRMSESILSILRHILRGEKIIKDRLNKADDPTDSLSQPDTEQNSSNTASSSNNIQILPHMPDVNYDHMCQLLDMGFPLEQCREALLHTTSVEQATDYLLNNPQPRDQVMHNASTNRSPSVDTKSNKRSKDDECVPLSEDAINEFTKSALKTCLQLLDTLPDTVYRVCDLLVTIIKRNGEVYRNKMLDVLLSEIGNYMLQVLASLNNRENLNMVDEWLNGEPATKMAVRLHLYTLLFEGPVIHEMRIPCAQAVHRSGLLPLLIKHLILGERVMRSATDQNIQFTTPKWLTPLTLLLDLIEKVALCTQRKEEMHKSTSRIWRWYDLTTGRWTPYSSANNKLINEAYWNSENSMRVTCGRRRYTISFNNMGQTNDETANNRPIGMAIKNTSKNKDDSDVDDMDVDIEDLTNTERECKRNVPVPGLSEENCTRIVRSCVRLMELDVDRDTLHAVMRLCLRLTRDFTCARIFAEQGGVKRLLNMTQASSFSGFTTLATLLIRHVLEEPQTLCLAMEKVLRGRTLNTIPPQHKELQYLCRHISSVVCRNPDAFIEVGKTILRVDINELNRRGDEEDTRLILRCEPPTRSPAQPIDEAVSINVIYDLLNALIKPTMNPELATPSSVSTNLNVDSNSISSSQLSGASSSSLTPLPITSNNTSRPLPPHVQNPSDLSEPQEELTLLDKPKESTTANTSANKPVTDEDSKKLLLPKHALLKMLAEAVRSYGAVAKLITEYTYKAGQSELITEDCSAIAFLLDNLLPVNENFSDPDCSMMVRMLIAAIASCNHSPDAQASLVSELKSALCRALSMAESQEKHMQIQLLAGLVSTMIEHCPPSQHTSVRGLKLHSIGHNPNVLNNIVKIMLRKGFLADLARIPHCLDLSSPIMAMTINSALKPLETLSRIVNQPTNGISPKYMSSKKNPGEERVNSNEATSTEATNAQGEEAVDDAENTEHDMSGTAESLEPLSEGHPQEVGDVDRLEDIMDQLLDRENPTNNRTYSDVASGRNLHSMDIDEDVNAIRNIVYETDRDVTEELMSTDSGESVSNPSDNEVEDDTNDDEDVEDDEMDEGDDNEENNYDEDGEYNGLGFFDNENPGLFRITPSAEREEEVLMIQYSDPDSESDSVSRMVHWNSNGLHFPFGMFEEGNTNNDNSAPPSSHPLLMSRHNLDGPPMSASRTQRTNRQRRYQYLQINARNQNPPVILQRLLGPAGQTMPMSGPVMSEPPIRVTNRVVLMENGFNLFPTAEEQIDLVDQSGYLFGPSLAATLNNIPSALHWWNEEKSLLDGESHTDVCVAVCAKLIPIMEQHRDAELNEKKRKRQEEMGAFTYKGLRLKSPEEIMDLDKIRLFQSEMKSDNSSVDNESTSDNTQLLAETIVESVLRPNNLQGRDNRRASQEESSQPSIIHPDPVALINGDMWEYSETPMAGSETDNQDNIGSSSNAQQTSESYSESDQIGNLFSYSENQSNNSDRTNSQNERTVQNDPSESASCTTEDLSQESNSIQYNTSTINNAFDAHSGYVAQEMHNDLFNSNSSEINPVVRLRNMAANRIAEASRNGESQGYHSGSRINEPVTVSHSLQMDFNISSSNLPGSQPNTSIGSDGIVLETDENDIANDSFRSEDNEIISILNNSQPSEPRTQEGHSHRLRSYNEQSEEQNNRMDNDMTPDLFSSEEDCNMDEDDENIISPVQLPPTRLERGLDGSNRVDTNLAPDFSHLITVSSHDLNRPVMSTPNSNQLSSSPIFISSGESTYLAPGLSQQSVSSLSQQSGSPQLFDDPTPVLLQSSDHLNTTNESFQPNLNNSSSRVSRLSQTSQSSEISTIVLSFPEHHIISDTELDQVAPTGSQTSIITISDSDISNTTLQQPDDDVVNSEVTFSQPNQTDLPSSQLSNLSWSQDLLVPIRQVPYHEVEFSSNNSSQTGSYMSSQNTDESINESVEQEDNTSETQTSIENTNTESKPNDSNEESTEQALEHPVERPTNQLTNLNQSNSNLPNEDVPPGVDPSFLEALPEEVRLEVIAEQNRLARMRSQANTSSASDNVGSVEVNPEFLAALPPALQEEVLAQQRLEQQRQAAAAANPDDPVDAAAFFQNLQPSLRQAILTDIDETQMSALPPDLAAEAQNLRRDWEARNRQLMQERFLNQLQSNNTLSSILRQSGRARLGGARYTIHTLPQRWNAWNRDGGNNSGSPVTGPNLRIRGRQLLDHESLSCLLVLLFADEPKLNTLRLHRVIRNLCYHVPTRDWIVKALLSIIERSVNIKIDAESPNPKTSKRVIRPGPLCAKLQTDPRSVNNNAAWLNIKMDAALGCRANVFIVHRNQSGKKNDRQSTSSVTIHPQAAPIVCRHTLDLFISLAKSFPSFFLPLKVVRDDEIKEKDIIELKKITSPTKNKGDSTDFWDMLLKLDSLSATKKGKSVAKIHNSSNLNPENENIASTFESSTFAQLMTMLSSPVIKRSPQLTDKLLKLLSLITVGLPDLPNYLLSGKSSNKGKTNTKVSSCYLAFEDSLRLVIDAITDKNCSEEGLEDAATLLFNIANCTEEMRYLVLWQMLNGMLKLASEITVQIKDLLVELMSINQLQRSACLAEEGPSIERPSKGLMNNRFTHEPVVITALAKVKQSCDLQLPAMAPLTNKISSQAFFLRLLRLVAQIHESIRKSASNTPIDMNIEKTKTDEGDVEDDNTNMETNTAHSPKTSLLDMNFEIEKELPILSEMMNLGKLWQMLSECLLELEHTPDHHAVLVLQPTVEAFFLVHSPQKASNESNEERDEPTSTGENRLITDADNLQIESSQDSSSTSMNQSTQSTQSAQIAQNSQIVQNNQSVQNSQSTQIKQLKEIPIDQQKFLHFAEKHRTVLNQILRQTNAHLADGPFSVLVDHTRILDFDVKRKYFRTELERLDSGIRREETAVHVRRSHVFEDSFRELYRRTPEEWKNRFYIVFEEEEGQDAGGLLREWYMIISRDIFNPMYALFTVSPGDRVTYMINSSSHCNPNHLCYYKFVGRVIAKAIYDNKLLECYFTRSFYKHILGIPIKYTDMESEDYSFYSGLQFLIQNKVKDLGYEITFSQEMNEFGSTNIRELMPGGRNILVTDENKMEYIRLLCQMKMTDAIKQQLKAFLEGFYDIIPKRLISIFNEQELELLISGLPNVDIEDLKSNTEYHKYQSTSLQIQWFWRALRSFDQADRAKFLQFVTGTSKVPLQGFIALEGMNGTQKFQIHRDDRSTDRLPSAHTCFNQLDLPVYETYDKLRLYLLKAIHECSEGFGFA